MDLERDDPEVFSDEERVAVETEEEEEEEDAVIFEAWMHQYRAAEPPLPLAEEKEEEGEEGEEEGGEGLGQIESVRPESRCSIGPTMRQRRERRASLPSASILSSMQLSRLHSSARCPVTASVLLRRSSSRRLMTSQPLMTSHTEATPPGPATPPERRASLTPTAPETKRAFRRRNVMSLSDAYTVCLLCHNDLSQGSGGTRELACTHTFHRECIEEWLWRKHSCPTCHTKVSTPQPLYLSNPSLTVP